MGTLHTGPIGKVRRANTLPLDLIPLPHSHQRIIAGLEVALGGHTPIQRAGLSSLGHGERHRLVPFGGGGFGDVKVWGGDRVRGGEEVGLHLGLVDFARRAGWGVIVWTAVIEIAWVDGAAAAEVVFVAAIEGLSGRALGVVAGGEGEGI